jgi:hypothetical protein
MKVKNPRIFAIMALIFLYSYNVFAGESCNLYEVTDVATSGDLASLMGKHRIFDIDLMMKYDDNVILPRGEVVLLESKFQRAKMLIGSLNSDGIREYSIDGVIIPRSKLGLRGIASEKKQLKLCRH